MKILFVTTEIPYPPDNGVRIKSFHALRLMAKDHKVALVVLTSETEGIEGRIRELKNFCDEVTVVALRRRSNLSIASTSMLRSKLFYIERYRDTVFLEKLRDVIARWLPDVIHFDLILMSQYGRLINPAIASVVSINDSYALSLENELKRPLHQSARKRLYRTLQLKFTKDYEAKTYTGFDYCHVVSAVDKDYLERLNPAIRTIVIPNGVDIDYLQPSESKAVSAFKNAIFVGKMAGINLIYLEHFITKAWRLVKKAIPDANLDVIGGKPSKSIENIAAKAGGVTFKGYVDNLRDCYNDSLIAVVPIQKNCGLVNKAIEAMAMGLAVVGFNETFAGIPQASHNHNCIGCNSHQDMASQIIRLFKVPECARVIGSNACDMIKNHYCWGKRRESYEYMYEEAIKIHGKVSW